MLMYKQSCVLLALSFPFYVDITFVNMMYVKQMFYIPVQKKNNPPCRARVKLFHLAEADTVTEDNNTL